MFASSPVCADLFDFSHLLIGRLCVAVIVLCRGASCVCMHQHTSYVTRHTSHVTRHTSHVTCHTSRVSVCLTCFLTLSYITQIALRNYYQVLIVLHARTMLILLQCSKTPNSPLFTFCSFPGDWWQNRIHGELIFCVSATLPGAALMRGRHQQVTFGSVINCATVSCACATVVHVHRGTRPPWFMSCRGLFAATLTF